MNEIYAKQAALTYVASLFFLYLLPAYAFPRKLLKMIADLAFYCLPIHLCKLQPRERAVTVPVQNAEGVCQLRVGCQINIGLPVFHIHEIRCDIGQDPTRYRRSQEKSARRL